MVEICVYWTMFFLVSTSVAFDLISVALTEFCAEFECFSQDLTEMLLILWWIRLLSSLYLPALCITVSRDREQSAAPARVDKPKRVARIRSAFSLFVRCSSCKSVMMRTQGCSFHFFKLRNNLSLTQCALQWCHGTHLNPKSAENLRQLRKFASSCKKCGVCLILW